MDTTITRRRSQRLFLQVRVVVQGVLPTGTTFSEETHTIVVNAHGALVEMETPLEPGQIVTLRNVRTNEQIECTTKLVKPVDPGELIARVIRLLDRTPSNGDAASPNGKLESLTQRENEVLDLLAEGLTQEEIADRLVISPKTAATHIQRILSKLGVRSRAQAVALVLREERDVSGHGVQGDALHLLV